MKAIASKPAVMIQGKLLEIGIGSPAGPEGMRFPSSQSVAQSSPEVPPKVEAAAKSVFSVFDRDFFARTLAIVSAYFLTMIPFYFVLNWTPKVLVDEGLSAALGL